MALGAALLVAVGAAAAVAAAGARGQTLACGVGQPPAANDTMERDARAWLGEHYEAAAAEINRRAGLASWAYATNVTEHNERRDAEESVRADAARAALRDEARALFGDYNRLAPWPELCYTTRRQLTLLLGGSITPKGDADRERLAALLGEMSGIYARGCVRGLPNAEDPQHCATLEPELEELLATSHDYDELLAVWRGWHDNVGTPIGPLYREFVEVSNRGAREALYNDTGAFWRSWYDISDEQFRNMMDRAWNELKPLYEQLHAYVRNRLGDAYGRDLVPPRAPIPAHLLGNMWAQDWTNTWAFTQPYPEAAASDVTAALRAKDYTPVDLHRLSEAFYGTLTFEALPKSYYTKSMLERPPDGRDVLCHASAWDLEKADANDTMPDVRCKQCTVVDASSFYTVHHEEGHIFYYLEYRNQPILFRSGANDGFHEAIGDTIVKSVVTPANLAIEGLLGDWEPTDESEINFLMQQALQVLAFLPFGFLVDQYRWDLFAAGGADQAEWNATANELWWRKRIEIQGIAPPVERDATGFDAGGKYHVPGNTPYARYFLSHVYQFDFHQQLCEVARAHEEGEWIGPLSNCSVRGSEAAGRAFRSMMQLGQSRPWTDALVRLSLGAASCTEEQFEQCTAKCQVAGTYLSACACPDGDAAPPAVNCTEAPTLNVRPIVNYFAKLDQWLKRENADNKVSIGWDTTCGSGEGQTRCAAFVPRGEIVDWSIYVLIGLASLVGALFVLCVVRTCAVRIHRRRKSYQKV